MDHIDERVEDGGVADFKDHRGRVIGRGYVNRKSQIIARVLTFDSVDVDAAFFRERVTTAIALRDRVVEGSDAYRLIYSESDRLPGLIVDRYGDVLVVQFLTLGMEHWRDLVLATLSELVTPSGIYERSDSPIRAHEGLDKVSGPLTEDCPEEIVFRESGKSVIVDIAGGQKTGYFLDQRENRAVVEAWSAGARVLDCFCHTGGFALSAAAGGAREVVGIDSSAAAINMANRNAGLNAFGDRCHFYEGNVFDALRVYAENDETFDLIILDPPAFTRGKSTISGASRGYKDINLRAMQILRSGGLLMTCSCSFHMSEALFRDVLADSAKDAGRTVRIIETRTQARDHPVLHAARETQYLKCLLLQVF